MTRKLLLALLYIGIPIVFIAGTYSALHHFALDPADPTNPTTSLIDVTDGSFRSTAKTLEEAKLIRSAFTFRLMARFQGKDTLVKSGEYELSPSMAPQAILDKMVRGDMFRRRITIKEGMTLTDITAALKDAGIIASEQFQAILSDPAFIKEQGLDASSFEGYLFPETYDFPRNTPAKKIISAMREQFEKRWSPEWTQRAQILELTKHQVLTLASIIEKESGNFDEQPIIASVFHNRLRKKMRLQADPTVIYGIKNFNGNITKQDLTTSTPYNTYVIDGLPPGPIANPGINAIKATLYPADTNYLYFVGNGQGAHIFSETLEAHNVAVNQYQRRAGGGAETTAQDVTPPESLVQQP